MLFPWSLILLLGFHEVQARRRLPTSHLQLIKRQYDAPAHVINAEDKDHQRDFQSFVTRPDIDAPRYDVTVYNPDALAPGYFFVTPYQKVEQTERDGNWVGPHIYDQTGELIWSGAPLAQGFSIFGMKKTAFNGADDMLSMIYRKEFGAIINSSYQIHERVHVEEGFDLNMHEFNVVDNGTRILTMRTAVKDQDISIPATDTKKGYDGPCKIRYVGFEERDADTLEVTFSWMSEDRLWLEDTMYDDGPWKRFCTEPSGWDYIHCNSIDKFSDGDFLLACRHSDTVYKISHRTGEIVWRLGGKSNDFDWADRKHDDDLADYETVQFRGQHDVKVFESAPNYAIISMLDNAWRPGRNKKSGDFSRGLLIQVKTNQDRAKILQEYPHPQRELIQGRGSMQVLPNGNAFCGFTHNSYVAEYAHDGTVLMEAQLRPEMKSYRGYKFPWVGHPVEPPDVYAVAFAEEGEKEYKMLVYVSWNGATEVRTWNIYSAHADGKGRGTKGELLTSTPKTGFETAITYNGYAAHVTVEALDRDGNVLDYGTSEVTATVGPAALTDGTEELDIDEVGWIEKHLPHAASDQSPVANTFTNIVVAFGSGVIFCSAAFLIVLGVRQCWRQRGQASGSQGRSWSFRRPVAWWKQRKRKGEAEEPVYDQLLHNQGSSEEEFGLDETEYFELEHEDDRDGRREK